MNKNPREIHMEDINDTIVVTLQHLEQGGFISTDDASSDRLFEALSAVLEKHFNYPDYANYN